MTVTAGSARHFSENFTCSILVILLSLCCLWLRGELSYLFSLCAAERHSPQVPWLFFGDAGNH